MNTPNKLFAVFKSKELTALFRSEFDAKLWVQTEMSPADCVIVWVNFELSPALLRISSAPGGGEQANPPTPGASDKP